MNEEITKTYVVGFVFTHHHVLLIEKQRPEGQRGKWNGIGGKIEEGEDPIDAMRRECLEETGAAIGEWTQYCIISNRHNDEKWGVYFFHTELLQGVGVDQTTDEKVEWHNPAFLPNNIVDNIKWLIPMALAKSPVMAHVVEKR